MALAPDFSAFVAAFDTWLTYSYHAKIHQGDGMEDMSPGEAWQRLLTVKRVCPPETLEVYLSPRIGPLTVHANGVTYKGLDYGRGQLAQYFGRKVFIRVRRTLEAVSVWSCDDKELLGVADAVEGLPFLADQQDLRRAIQEKRRDTRKLKESFEPSLRIHETVAERMARLTGSKSPDRTPTPSPDPDPYVLKPYRGSLDGHAKELQQAFESTQLRLAAGAESLSITDELALYGDRP